MLVVVASLAAIERYEFEDQPTIVQSVDQDLEVEGSLKDLEIGI